MIGVQPRPLPHFSPHFISIKLFTIHSSTPQTRTYSKERKLKNGNRKQYLHVSIQHLLNSRKKTGKEGVKNKEKRGAVEREERLLHNPPFNSTPSTPIPNFQFITSGGGDANVKYAWYGCARDDVLGIVAQGFGRCGDFEDGVSHGIGVYLSPANVSSDSAMKTKEDEHRVRHMLLCRVILGNTETIAAGSRQFKPSSANFDSGINNPLSPTKYTIWSAYMNSHISPNYIISFISPSFTGSGETYLPNSPRMKFPHS